ncbi:hypothetical protein BDN72DRAFT_863810 [Pluteus cervinus]|uniref:Uncharacterized protein n=1 Tax=Pluteus cervinus TaxID=181527 RepID=A0ACD3A793_9AGAR|nr:hypothetical protein BDN72DRAFT_863810 [Pluteus cervinus]
MTLPDYCFLEPSANPLTPHPSLGFAYCGYSTVPAPLYGTEYEHSLHNDSYSGTQLHLFHQTPDGLYSQPDHAFGGSALSGLHAGGEVSPPCSIPAIHSDIFRGQSPRYIAPWITPRAVSPAYSSDSTTWSGTNEGSAPPSPFIALHQVPTPLQAESNGAGDALCSCGRREGDSKLKSRNYQVAEEDPLFHDVLGLLRKLITVKRVRRSYMCPVSAKGCKWDRSNRKSWKKDNFVKHLWSHVKRVSCSCVPCDACGQVLSSKGNLKRHKEDLHPSVTARWNGGSRHHSGEGTFG